MPTTTPTLVKVRRKKALSSGATLLNLACTGDPFSAFLKGHYYYFVGDSDSGKSFLSMSCFAEATLRTSFKNHRLIYDNTEDGMLIDLDAMFNEEVADRAEPPARLKDETPVHSTTIEEFYYHLDDAIKRKEPFIYILDSMDGLTTEAEDKKFDEHKKAHNKKLARLRGEKREEGGEKEEKVAGSYGMDKAKKNSQNLRRLIKPLRELGSILIIISQTRDDPNGYTKTRGGGHSLAFYATLQIWTSMIEKIKPVIRGKKRDIGTRVKVDVRRNRITGKRASVELDIYWSSGIDDIGTCIDYLLEEDHWKLSKQTIIAKEFKIEATREKLIRLIEKRNLEKSLRTICGEVWAEVDAACRVTRKNRYAKNDESDNNDDE